MQQTGDVDQGRAIDWSSTSADYAEYRPDPPESFFARLRTLGVGLPGQRILDLGTGTGALARTFATQGARVAGTDIAEGQIEAARELALKQGLEIQFETAPSEEIPFPDSSFDVVTANQCWLYFDLQRTIPEVLRVLDEGGTLVTSHFTFLPRLDPIVRASEELVLEHNPKWSGADWDGHIPAHPKWSRSDFVMRAMFFYDEAIPFTRESWRGRIRALRGIGATSSTKEVAVFDRDHERLLAESVPEAFTILHRLDAHFFVPKE